MRPWVGVERHTLRFEPDGPTVDVIRVGDDQAQVVERAAARLAVLRTMSARLSPPDVR